MSLEPEELEHEATQVAVLYHEENLTLREVADRLNISEPTAARRLAWAKDHGIIRVTIFRPTRRDLQLRLQTRLAPHGIRQVLVVDPPFPETESGSGQTEVGAVAARWLENNARARMTIVLDGGRTVGALVSSIHDRAFSRLSVLPLVADPISDDASAWETAIRLVQKCPVESKLVKLPFHQTPALADLNRQARAAAKDAAFVFLGVGPLHSTDARSHDFLVHLGLDRDEIRRTHPQVAAISGNFFIDAQGGEVPVPAVQQRMQRSLTFEELQGKARTKRCTVALLAAGASKASAVLATCRAQIANSLFADVSLAEELLRLSLEPIPSGVTRSRFR